MGKVSTISAAVLAALWLAASPPAWGLDITADITGAQTPALIDDNLRITDKVINMADGASLSPTYTCAAGSNCAQLVIKSDDPATLKKADAGLRLGNAAISGIPLYDIGYLNPNNSGGGHTASLIVGAGKAATLNGISGLEIYGNGQFILEDGASATLNYADNSSVSSDIPANIGYLTMGRQIITDIPWGCPGGGCGDSPKEAKGGLLKLGVGSNLTINKGSLPRFVAYFGEGSEVDVGLNTLTLPGDAIFKGGSTYTLERDDSATGRITISGTAKIESGALLSVADIASPTVNASNSVILSASGGLIDNTVFFNPLYSLKINGNNVEIDQYLGAGKLVNKVAQASGSGVSNNFVQGRNLIDRVLTDPAGSADAGSAELRRRLIGSMEKIDAAVANQPGQAEIALRQLIGEEALTAIHAQAETMDKSAAALNNRFQAIHHFRRTPAAGYGGAENRVWLGGFGAWNRQKNNDDVFGYDYDAGGVMLGYDREIAEGLTLGLNGSWSGGKLKNNDGLAETDVKIFGLGLYGSYEFGGGFFVDASLNYGRVQNDAEISFLGARKTSEFDGRSFGAGLNFGYAAELGENVYLTPSAGLRFIHLKQDGWQEKIVSDPDNLAVANWFGDSSHNFLEIPLGLKLETVLTSSGGVRFTPELRLGGVITANKSDSELRMGFAGSGDSAVIRGISPSQSRFTVGTGMKVQLNDTVDIFADYDLEARSGYQGHSLSGGLGFSF